MTATRRTRQHEEARQQKWAGYRRIRDAGYGQKGRKMKGFPQERQSRRPFPSTTRAGLDNHASVSAPDQLAALRAAYNCLLGVEIDLKAEMRPKTILPTIRRGLEIVRAALDKPTG